MEANTLKVIAGEIVTQSEVSNPAKLQLLNWIQNEATEVEVKSLLLDGEIPEKLDEQAEEIVNVRFEKSKLSEIDVGQGFGNIIIRLSSGEARVATAAAVGAIVYAGIKVAQKFSTSKNCKDFKYGTPGHEKCERDVKNQKILAQIKAIQAKAGLCKNAKDPAKCKAKIQAKIAELKGKMRS